jgi:hypothetical protein
MRAALGALDQGSRTLSFFLGVVVLGLFAAALATSLDAGDIIRWAREVFGVSFILALSALVVTALHCWMRLEADGAPEPARLETGLHAANGVATLALTYTLLGISLGIGSLANHDLGPETIQVVIRDLTRHFSMAFLTTVVGLPVSAVLRAMLMIRTRRIEARVTAPTTIIAGDLT